MADKATESATKPSAKKRLIKGHPPTEIVQMHDDFYRDRSFQMFIVACLTFIIFSTYIFLLIYRFTNRPAPVYFEAQRLEFPVANESGEVGRQFRLIKPVPLDKQRVSNSVMFIWVSQSLADIFSFNFQNSERHFDRVQNYFTEKGWSEFTQSLKDANLIKQVKRGRFIVNARAVAPPRLNEQGVYKDRFEWHVDVEMFVRYRSSQSETRQRWRIKVIAVRTPVSKKHDRGIAIDYFKVEDVRSTIR